MSKDGGILLYIKDSSVASAIKLDNDFPEQVCCKLVYVLCEKSREKACSRWMTLKVTQGHHWNCRYLISHISLLISGPC